MSSPLTHGLPIPENETEVYIVSLWTGRERPSFVEYACWYETLVDRSGLPVEQRHQMRNKLVDMWLKTCCRCAN